MLLKMDHAIAENVYPDHKREQIIPIFMCIVFGALIVSAGHSSSWHNKTIKKPVILSAFKASSTQEINLLVELMLKPLYSCQKSTSNFASIGKGHLGLLSLLGDIMKTLGSHLVLIGRFY